MPDHCANPKCGKELIHVEGRKKKKYCNQKCNNADWQKRHYIPSTKIPKTKRIPIEEYQKLIFNSKPLKSETIELLNENVIVYGLEQKSYDCDKIDNPQGEPNIPNPSKEQIEKQIAEIRKEKIPAHRDTVFGRKSWKIEQDKRINELLKQLL